MRNLIATLAATTACVGGLVTAEGGNAAAPQVSSSKATTGYTTYTDIAYASGASQALDLYVPNGARGPLPVIVYVHGGAWLGSDKAELKRTLGWEALLDQGFAVASVNYTLSGAAKYPTQIHEVKSAVRFLRSVGPKYKLNGKIGLMGASAGGQIANVVGTSCAVRSLEGTIGVTRTSSCVDAVMDIAGPTDLGTLAAAVPTLSGAVTAYLGCSAGVESCSAAALKSADPTTYLASSRYVPPFLIAHGDVDTVVPLAQSQRFFTALKESCDNVSMYTLAGQDHFFATLGAFLEPFPARTVQTSKGCRKTTTSTEPPLSYATIGKFFSSNLR
ncbi:alpha/beta hydrolase [Nocardioides sp. YR527]|uniref:alpha/beta hydrolase n=1 Tax=Nocardioides sp. YR527 TaxID=1881028 RepID=UPI0015A03DDC|nr:alpha/beta hydrolase [Nocardioides sp. YR527]